MRFAGSGGQQRAWTYHDTTQYDSGAWSGGGVLDLGPSSLKCETRLTDSSGMKPRLAWPGVGSLRCGGRYCLLLENATGGADGVESIPVLLPKHLPERKSSFGIGQSSSSSLPPSKSGTPDDRDCGSLTVPSVIFLLVMSHSVARLPEISRTPSSSQVLCFLCCGARYCTIQNDRSPVCFLNGCSSCPPSDLRLFAFETSGANGGMLRVAVSTGFRVVVAGKRKSVGVDTATRRELSHQ